MKLYKILAANYETYFGTTDNPIDRSYITIIAQTPSCDAFLFLCKDAQDAQTGLSLLSTVPAGFDFTYCQEWGLTINDAVVDKVIIDLRKKNYGTIEDQLDMQYWDIVNSTNNWKTAIDTVKTNYPK
tara:strand:+ start:122 stop:502 length:381 start_codon:yes stop_codon:yes gene_type:complete